jgi:hypothetical protein
MLIRRLRRAAQITEANRCAKNQSSLQLRLGKQGTLRRSCRFTSTRGACATLLRVNPSINDAGLRPLGGGKADDLLLAPHRERALCCRQKRFFDVFPGAGNKIAAATEVELALNIFTVALNRFYTEME